jgi:predicted nucleic acid-binding protein
MGGSEGEIRFMKILIDTNILVDVALERQPFFVDSDYILGLVEERAIEGFIAASSVSDLFYILRKSKGKKLAIQFLQTIFLFCQIATVDNAVIRQALMQNWDDFEDAIQYETAIASNLDGIVTRNPKDFSEATIPIFIPSKLIETIEGLK